MHLWQIRKPPFYGFVLLMANQQHIGVPTEKTPTPASTIQAASLRRELLCSAPDTILLPGMGDSISARRSTT
jgi:hypothetical protein